MSNPAFAIFLSAVIALTPWLPRKCGRIFRHRCTYCYATLTPPWNSVDISIASRCYLKQLRCKGFPSRTDPAWICGTPRGIMCTPVIRRCGRVSRRPIRSVVVRGWTTKGFFGSTVSYRGISACSVASVVSTLTTRRTSPKCFSVTQIPRRLWVRPVHMNCASI